MQITITTELPNGNTLFLVDKNTGEQVDLPLSMVNIDVCTDFVEVYTIHEVTQVPVQKSMDVGINSRWAKGFESLNKLEVGRVYILNGGAGTQAFHLPVFLEDVVISSPIDGLVDTKMGLVGLNDVVYGYHNPYQVVRFDVGDGTYKEAYIAYGETANEVVARWYNRQGQWKW